MKDTKATHFVHSQVHSCARALPEKHSPVHCSHNKTAHRNYTKNVYRLLYNDNVSSDQILAAPGMLSCASLDSAQRNSVLYVQSLSKVCRLYHVDHHNHGYLGYLKENNLTCWIIIEKFSYLPSRGLRSDENRRSHTPIAN